MRHAAARLHAWTNVRGLAANTPNLGFYMQPGRSVSVAVDVRF